MLRNDIIEIFVDSMKLVQVLFECFLCVIGLLQTQIDMYISLIYVTLRSHSSKYLGVSKCIRITVFLKIISLRKGYSLLQIRTLHFLNRYYVENFEKPHLIQSTL